jgi:hypothetical protein
VEIRPNKGASQPKLALDKGSRDAMADYFRLRWPSNTAKHAAREFGLTVDQAQSVVKGRASITTLDQIEKAGGWPVIFAVKALVIGQGADQYLAGLRASHENRAERLGALLSDWRALPADPRSDPDSLGDDVGERRRTFSRRMGAGKG